MTFMPRDPRLSFCLGSKLSYGSGVRFRNDDLNAERAFFREGYDAICRVCMRMCSCHAGNMARRAPIGNRRQAERRNLLDSKRTRYQIAGSLDRTWPGKYPRLDVRETVLSDFGVRGRGRVCQRHCACLWSDINVPEPTEQGISRH